MRRGRGSTHTPGEAPASHPAIVLGFSSPLPSFQDPVSSHSRFPSTCVDPPPGLAKQSR